MTKNKKAASPATNQKETASSSQVNNRSLNVEHQDPNSSLMALTYQAVILLGWLKHEGKIDTLEARRRGINHPAGRINDLRNKKVQIETHWINAISQTGKAVKVALYVLRHNPQRSIFDFLETGTKQGGHG